MPDFVSRGLRGLFQVGVVILAINFLEAWGLVTFTPVQKDATLALATFMLTIAQNAAEQANVIPTYGKPAPAPRVDPRDGPDESIVIVNHPVQGDVPTRVTGRGVEVD